MWPVSWLPSDGRLVTDPRLDPYRGRVGLLIWMGHLVGHVLVSAEYIAEQTGGHAWWRCWSPFEEVAAVHLRYSDHGRSTISWVGGPDLVAELTAWRARQFRGSPEDLGLRWLSREESATTAWTVFGVTLNNHSQTT